MLRKESGECKIDLKIYNTMNPFTHELHPGLGPCSSSMRGDSWPCLDICLGCSHVHGKPFHYVPRQQLTTATWKQHKGLSQVDEGLTLYRYVHIPSLRRCWNEMQKLPRCLKTEPRMMWPDRAHVIPWLAGCLLKVIEGCRLSTSKSPGSCQNRFWLLRAGCGIFSALTFN